MARSSACDSLATMDESPRSERKSALPPGFGDGDNAPGGGQPGSSILMTIAVAAVVAAAVAGVVPRLMVAPPLLDALAQRVGQQEEQQQKLSARLAGMEAKLAALSKDRPAPDGSDGESRAREKLESRVEEGIATADELKMLRAICRHQNDKACSDRMTDLLAAMPDAATPSEGGAAEGAFDKVAAIRTLTNAAARARSCGRHEGEPGRTRVTVTFEPSGVVSVAEVSGEFPRREAAKACVQSAFRSARVPRFDGPSVKVTKTAELVAPEIKPPAQPAPTNSELEY